MSATAAKYIDGLPAIRSNVGTLADAGSLVLIGELLALAITFSPRDSDQGAMIDIVARIGFTLSKLFPRILGILFTLPKTFDASGKSGA